jgi:hypothetical protein
MAFAELYKSITAIVAYDKADEFFDDNLFRPWILHECHSFRFNRQEVIMYTVSQTRGCCRCRALVSNVGLGSGEMLEQRLWQLSHGRSLQHQPWLTLRTSSIFYRTTL